ncbi:hypothetical protein J5Y04_38425 [Kitasatospora sp. RG8]|uniref:hypothetical protein n=1 Tax=Kitasatospora sp. RG8 TaxID=2820815 RepID=UPI001AE0E729|nr:hypothetical protein [Kitasatospora sp. RG8]MBP0455354.1 hypothetical protein [Kitasatospora sp. RG8]
MSTRKRDSAPAYRPRVGELVLDTRTGRTGVYMDTLGGEHYLRPTAGGREWTARPDQVGPAPDDPDPDPADDPHARLHARLAARNRNSRLNESQVA